jgi:hypothetical protein
MKKKKEKIRYGFIKKQLIELQNKKTFEMFESVIELLENLNKRIELLEMKRR